MPYFNSLANNYGVATQYYANTHPSIGNYFMLTTGQILTNDDTKIPANFPVSADNIVRHLIASGRSWKSYAEDLPAVGQAGNDFNNYSVHHNPFAYFTDVQNDSTQLNNLVPFADPNAGFAHDLAAAATAPSMGEFFKPVQCTTTCDTTPPSVPTGLTATSVGGLQVIL